MMTSNEMRIRRHSPFTAAVRMPLTAMWVSIRFLLIPVLWLPYRLGSRMNWAFATDSFMKRLLFPLTEGPDEAPQNNVNAHLSHLALQPSAEPIKGVSASSGIPSEYGWVRLGRQPIDLEKFADGRPLLLILFRGSWCPYSRLHLADLSTAAHSLEELGVAILAVSARNHDRWWRSKGIGLTFASDPDGELFRIMGVRVEPPLSHRVWGMALPHESVFLFNRNGNLLVADVRRLNSIKTRQTFLSAARWLKFARELVATTPLSPLSF